ncbi:putative holin-like toxin [Enterococcus faecalis]|nr:putative holin-like toxin [Enterococcus faecalis]EIA6622876.1 putative holin-like toxin [Enterococcus faecalis]EIA6788421.1 putative holin-like toxin [Enterococcus faecalis]MBP4077471.1 putative holin-like toxin [Enterococcus faecalis]MBP4095646.1 putative holin-like toxin [Enterococcus faecalis]MUN83877.1 putative holin-like toxin [Enterococcus faecalis]
MSKSNTIKLILVFGGFIISLITLILILVKKDKEK